MLRDASAHQHTSKSVKALSAWIPSKPPSSNRKRSVRRNRSLDRAKTTFSEAWSSAHMPISRYTTSWHFPSSAGSQRKVVQLFKLRILKRLRVPMELSTASTDVQHRMYSSSSRGTPSRVGSSPRPALDGRHHKCGELQIVGLVFLQLLYYGDERSAPTCSFIKLPGEDGVKKRGTTTALFQNSYKVHSKQQDSTSWTNLRRKTS